MGSWIVDGPTVGPLAKGDDMAILEPGDWGDDGLPLWIRERIREVDLAMEQLVRSLEKLGSAVGGMAIGAERAVARQG
ncbi:MAG TPA: hypothetical protein VHC23_10940 [Jatrophihabitans sp.]|jgi:hypothetical protein|nr:hypothetical protein [Jatrophihabitans sp.]